MELSGEERRWLLQAMAQEKKTQTTLIATPETTEARTEKGAEKDKSLRH